MGHSFFSCDWGTSNFRLRLVDASSLKIAAEVRTAVGIDRLEGSNPERFSRYLVERIRELPGVGNTPAAEAPLWISGMASSSIGWQELDYAGLPFSLDGSTALVADLGPLAEDLPHPVRLVSGISSATEILRGEETEALGLLDILALAGEELLLILPGTHSKHLGTRGGEIISMQTFMTGELYAILSQHSILRHTVEEPASIDGLEDAFLEGVHCGSRKGLSGSLFTARTRQVLDGKTSRENGAWLSGLLLSAELGPARNEKNRVLVAAGGLLGSMYLLAAAELGLETFEAIDEQHLELAAVAGHALLERTLRGALS